jgi:MYXO-CTERM domain-containing protein
MTRLRFPLSSLLAFSLAGAALAAPGCGDVDDGSAEPTGSLSQRATAGVVITEIGFDTPNPENADLEWIEVYNPGDVAFDLTGAKFKDNTAADEATLAPVTGNTITVPAQGYIVLGHTKDAVFANGGSGVTATYSTAGSSKNSLNNSGETITLTDKNGVVLDSVTYKSGSPWPSAADVAVQLSANRLDSDNNDGTLWCNATTAYAAGPAGAVAGKGTPGSANIVCPSQAGGGGAGGAAGAGTGGVGGIAGSTAAGAGGIAGSTTAGAGGIAGSTTAGAGGIAGSTTAGAGGIAGSTTAGAGGIAAGAGGEAGVGGAAGAGGGASAPEAPVFGDLVINELMADPKASDDAAGEWFEVRNISQKTLELQGIILKSDDVTHTVASSIIVPPDGYALFAKSGDSSKNGGLPATAYVYGSKLNLANSGTDSIVINAANGDLLDSVSYAAKEIKPGMSRTLSADFSTPDTNGTDTEPAAEAWCLGSSPFGAGDFGTPGLPNDPCATGTAGAGGSSAGGTGGMGTAGSAGSGTAGKGGTGGSSAAGAGGSTSAGAGGVAQAGAGGSVTAGAGGSEAAGAGGSATAGAGGTGAAGKGGSGTAGSGTAGSAAGGKAGSAGKGGSAGKAGAAGSGGTLPPEEEPVESGCGCRTAPASTPASPASLALAALGLALFGRRKSKQR